MAQVYARMGAALEEIARQGGNIAVVSHGCAIRNYICRVTDGSIEALRVVPLCDNTGITLIEYDENFVPSIVHMNDAAHLGDLSDPRFLKR